jgi:Zn-dependent protease
MAGLLPIGGEDLIGHPGYILGLAATMLAPFCLLGGRVAERVQMEPYEEKVMALWGLALANLVIWSLLQMEGSYWM